MSAKNDPDMDTRPIIVGWIQEHGNQQGYSEILEKIGEQDAETASAPEPASAPQKAPAPEPAAAEEPPPEEDCPLNRPTRAV